MSTRKNSTRITGGIACLLLSIALACGKSPEPVATPKTLSEGERLIDEALAAAEANDAKRAFELMQRAADLGEPEGIAGLASFVNVGLGTLADPIRARELWEEALARGSIGAKLNLGLSLLGSDSLADQALAVEMLQDLYESPPDDEGRERVRGATAGGLGTAYVFGIGVEKDLERGVDLLEESDATGAATAEVQFLLGRVWESGWAGRKVSPRKAYRHFLEAADQGNPAAQWNVGMALLQGWGTRADEEAAYQWIRRAAEAGSERAEISLAVMLALGQGVAENDEDARDWYGRGVARNLAPSLRGLGFMLLGGEGGPIDAPRGWAYLKLAADSGDTAAKQAMEVYLSEVSTLDQQAGEVIASEWVRRHGAPRLVPR